MKLPKDTDWNSLSLEHKRAFLRPLVVALIIGLFLSLILVMGIMDLGRLDKTLAGFMENRGLDIITTVENIAQENLDYLRQALKKGAKDDDVVAPFKGKVFSPQEALVKDLIVLAREIDARWRAGQLSEEGLKEIAEREKLWFVAVLDGGNKVVLKKWGVSQGIFTWNELCCDLEQRYDHRSLLQVWKTQRDGIHYSSSQGWKRCHIDSP